MIGLAECGGETAWAGEVEIVAALCCFRSSTTLKGRTCWRRRSIKQAFRRDQVVA
jgi:hypothetical protein